MNGAETTVEGARLLVLAAVFAIAAVADVKYREVSDRLWQATALVGIVVGAVVIAPDGLFALSLWLVVGAFTLEHLFPWDELLGERGERYVLAIELGAYLAVLLLLTSAAVGRGIGGSGVPVDAIALLVTVVLARGLFELGVLYGGADAKAVMAAGVVLPVLATPLWSAASFQAPVLAVLPFAVTVLTNAAVLSLAIPLTLFFLNVRRGEFDSLKGFTGYSLPVASLPRRFVWVRDEHLGQDGLADDVETSEEDQRRRLALSQELARRGIRRVWVSPQIPFVVLLALGALSGVLAGNLLLDVFRLAL